MDDRVTKPVNELMDLFIGCGFKLERKEDDSHLHLIFTMRTHRFKFNINHQTRKLVSVEVPRMMWTGWIEKEVGQLKLSNIVGVMDKLLVSGGYKSA